MPHDWSHIRGYQFIWVYAIVITYSHIASIMSHLRALMTFSYFLFLLKKYKIAYKVSHDIYRRVLESTFEKICFENIQQIRLLDDNWLKGLKRFCPSAIFSSIKCVLYKSNFFWSIFLKKSHEGGFPRDILINIAICLFAYC